MLRGGYALRRKTAENTVSDGREQENGAPPGLGWQGQPQRTAERKDDIDV